MKNLNDDDVEFDAKTEQLKPKEPQKQSKDATKLAEEREMAYRYSESQVV